MGLNLSRLWSGRFARQSPESAPETAPRWDFHCHLLPGVDDGLRTLEETRQAISGLQQLGYGGAVLTPHIYPGAYDNHPQGLRKAFAELQQQVSGDFVLHLAAEYFADESMLAAITEQNLLYLPLGEQKVVLVEFPVLMPSPVGTDILIELQRAGYQPVLAHVERYRYVQQQPTAWLEKIQHTGAWLQCDIGSLVGQYGPHPQTLARHLLAQNLPTLWGTDLHRVEQLERYMRPGLSTLTKRGVPINSALASLSAANSH
ncbi:CpsB/CapC family capsule biosynthesis tyrosine phosphatase [Acidithiobacillus sp.]|uniref:tyrosine-protein phosphatase n=1 Tax=Acidithiobacillus sp. TaxID=1872118 RepID=UPI002608A243|nr:CpsB/CapC family capsule biosynthesis tyrosine phosphatase [Acidithiobacillus sp.]MDD2748546.1 protein tyrosine phosphatase [Acidithiobacillus sp.]MDD5279307.1 protein tyrosine phosphatase [Acidithiobacillus sp.]